MNIEQKTMQCIADITGVRLADIKPETNLITELGCDSLDIVELAMALEQEFEINIDDDEAINLKTVQQVIDYVRTLTEGVKA